jgi:hypothetical protein
MDGRGRVGVLSAAAVSLLLVVASNAYAGDGTFASHVDYDLTGSLHFTAAVGDFDSDGDEDLAVTDGNVDKVSLLLSNGDGTFAAKVDYDTADTPFAVAAGDFDSDGDADLAVAAYNASKASILLGNGDGTFATKVDYDTAAQPGSLAVGDFDSDGDQDIALGDLGSAKVSILLGDGAGNFAAHVDLGTGTSPSGVAVGDFDSDGDQDLAVSDFGDSKVSILLGDGSPQHFAAKVDYTTGASPTGVVAGDFNSDGAEDLAFALGSPSGKVSILLGDGAGHFPAHVEYLTSAAPNTVAVGDFNSDGVEDLALPGMTGVSVLLGAGDGTFPTHVDYATATGASAPVVGDFDSDGNEDLAVAAGTKVSLLRGLGSQLLGGNLLQNGGAEGAGAARTRLTSPAVPAWTLATGSMTYVRYGTETRFSDLPNAPRWEGGLNMFSGGPSTLVAQPTSSVSQTADISSSAASIDGGLANATLSADLGGSALDGDQMQVQAEFIDASGAALGSFAIGPVTSDDRKNLTVLLRRSQTVGVPLGTRKIEVRVMAMRILGPMQSAFAYDNAYADNVKLTLDAPPPPDVEPPPGDQPPGSDPVDATAPDTLKGKGPNHKLHSKRATFEFSSDDPTATFTCRLDEKDATACTSPAKAKHLKNGKHAFTVIAVDASGNKDASPVVWKFKVAPKHHRRHL